MEDKYYAHSREGRPKEEWHRLEARGLKLKTPTLSNHLIKVAPHAGAWIETDCSSSQFRISVVAPSAGAPHAFSSG
jgi:hypothetical protein